MAKRVKEESLAVVQEQARAVPRRRANELDGATWTRHSISIWSDIRKTPEEIALGHPAIFPVQLPTRLIECFTRDDEKVILDPFAGTGATLVAAQQLGKVGIGIEISAEFAEKARDRLDQKVLFQNPLGGGIVYTADARRLLEFVPPESVDLVITSPPYWDILLQKRTADYKATRNYGDAPEDLGKIGDYGKFLAALRDIFGLVCEVLKPRKYCCVVVMDLRKKDRFYPFHADVAQFMQEIGFIYDDLIIWDRRREYSNMRPLGYPSVFRVNKAHEYILVFRKR